jgi:hypothetical protein
VGFIFDDEFTVNSQDESTVATSGSDIVSRRSDPVRDCLRTAFPSDNPAPDRLDANDRTWFVDCCHWTIP